MALFDNNKDNKEKGTNISKRIEKDIKKKKLHKIKGRGMTRKSYIKHDIKEDEKKEDNQVNVDKYMDLEEK